MKVVSPLVALAALARGASAARKEAAGGPKKRTIFHNDANGDIESGADDARRGRRKTPQSTLHKIERGTKVGMDHIVKESLARYKVVKKNRAEKEIAEVGGDQEENTGELPTVGEKRRSTLLRSAENSQTEMRTPTAFATLPRGPNEEEGAHPSTHVHLQEDATKKARRRDRAHDYVVGKKGRKSFDPTNVERRRAVKAGRDRSRRRRIREVTDPAPRPRRVAPSRKDTEIPESGKPREERGGGRDLKKSKKSSHSSSSKGGKGDFNEDKCVVRLTNLTRQQWFSDVFWMVHSDKVETPLWEYGEPAFSDLAALAQDGDTDELVDFFEDNDDGVLEVDSERGPIFEGDSLTFDIPVSGSYGLFTMAASFLFSNDGFVSIDAGDIRDGATWFLWGLDAGVEGNVQLCWTVPASSADFPPSSECSDIRESTADENDNRFPGEGFVHVHRGIHDFDGRSDLNDFLEFTCDDLDADNFVEYFQELGFDDEELLHDDDRFRNERDDESFLEFVEDNDDVYGNLIVFQIAVEAGSFRQFCRELNDINNFLFDTFETLEPQVFDFRTPMMRVEMAC